MADKLVCAGYKVARVEQTETPAQLAERKKKYKGKGAPKVVNREVCSIMTMGTRTFCYLDGEGLFEEAAGSQGGGGPLLAIREVTLQSKAESSSSNDENEGDKDNNMAVENDADHCNSNSGGSGDDAAVQPTCEYGVTIVDAVRGSVTIGQFADDVLRSRMNTLLTAFSPSEVR